MERISLDYTITDDKIRVESSSTIFINRKRKVAIDIIQLEKDIKEIKKICREKKITFSQKAGLYTYFKGNKNHYLLDIKNTNLLFDKLVQEWQQKIKKGIYTGYSNDTDLKALYELEWQIDAICRKDTIQKISSLYKCVKELKPKLQTEHAEFKKIVL